MNNRKSRRDIIKEFLKEIWTKKKKELFVIVCAFLMIAIIGVSFFLNGVSSISKFFVHRTALENTYYLSQIICSFVVIIGGIIGVWQYVLAKRVEKLQFNNARVQKAIDLAEYYKDNVLNNMQFIQEVYKGLDIYKILDNVDIEKMVEFDKYELDHIFSKEQIQSIYNKIDEESDNTDLVKTVQELSILYSRSDIYETKLSSSGDEMPEEDVRRNQKWVYREFMGKTVKRTLNNLEFFALNFVYQTADQKVVYQSLHETYLEIVKLLYFNIAINNKSGEQKLFTNVIKLFNIWKEVAAEQKLAEAQLVRSNIITGENVKSIS